MFEFVIIITASGITITVGNSISAQITDYGLPSFLAGQNFDESEHDTFRRK